MKKTGIKKVLLYISALPYVYCAVMSLYHAIFGYSYPWSAYLEDDYGIDGALAFLGEFWALIYDSIISLLLLGLCIAYQIYYFINLKTKREKNEKIEKHKVNIKKILFYIAITSWIIYFMTGVHAFFAGAKDGLFSDNIVYGIEATQIALTWNLLAFTYFPILPISSIYIIIYLLMKYREKGNSLEKLFWYVSLWPYIYVILMSIYSFVFGYEYFENKPEYGIKGTIDFIDEFLWDNFVEFNFVGGLVIACLCYQIYYLLRLKLSKKSINNKLDKNEMC